MHDASIHSAWARPQSCWHATVHIDSKTILNLCWMHKGISLLFNNSVPLQFLICWCYSSIWYIDHPRPCREASTTAPNQAQRSRKPEALNHTSGTELPSAWRLIGQWTNREHGMNASLFEMCIWLGQNIFCLKKETDGNSLFMRTCPFFHSEFLHATRIRE